MATERQKRTAARTAAANFTKYPKWLDPTDWTWKALYRNPHFELCRKVDGSGTSRDPLLCFELPDYWQGKLGLYLFVIYVDRLMPRPSKYHLLVPLDDSMLLYPGNMGWNYIAPKSRDRSPEAEDARTRFGNRNLLVREQLERERILRESPTEEQAWREREHCFCTSTTFDVDCTCRFAVEARLGADGSDEGVYTLPEGGA